MKIIVTGTGGFIGGNLEKEIKCIGVDRKQGLNISNDGKFQFFCDQVKPDFIVHLAASCSTPKSITNPRQDFEDNVMATFEVCEAARKHNSKIIFTSSCKAWTGTPYGTSKAACELYIKEYADTYGVEYVINRPGTVYGDGQDGSAESGWLGWFIKASILKKPITIYGDGLQSRDVLHVKDYVELLKKQIYDFNTYRNGTYEVGGGENNEISLLEALHLLKYRDFSFENKRIGDVRRFVAANEVPNWEPKIGYKEGIAETVKYYERILK